MPTESATQPALLTTTQAGARIGWSPSKVIRAANAGTLPVAHFGPNGARLFYPADVDAAAAPAEVAS